MLVAVVCSPVFVLWPDLHPWIFGLRPAALAADLDLVLTVPAVLAVLALTSEDAASTRPYVDAARHH